MTLVEKCRLAGLKHRTVRSRLAYGWTLKEALETPLMQGGRGLHPERTNFVCGKKKKSK